jgi:homoserine O-acetyltransferase
MDYFDLASNYGTLAAALDRVKARFLVISFTSDWLYPTYQSLETVNALRARNKDVAYVELESNYGHDAFLVEVQEQSIIVSGFLETTMRMERQEPRAHATVNDFAGRQDFSTITNWIAPESRVLDLGCGDGALIAWLGENKHCDARGVEIDRELVQRAIARGASAYQADIEKSLKDYSDLAFDYVILSQTLQQSRKPLELLRNILRVGRYAIVGFPNFSHWSVRWSHLVSGRAPQNELFPFEWYESPNIHFVTVKDFEMLCAKEGWTVEKRVFFSAQAEVKTLPNLTAEIAVYLLRR